MVDNECLHSTVLHWSVVQWKGRHVTLQGSGSQVLNLNMNHYRVSIDSGLLSQFNSQEKESTAHLSREGRSPGDWITQGSEEEWAWCILAGRKSGTCMYNRKAWKYANVSINFI